ncbi:MAG: ABC transporter permease [Sulfolobales archaeon]
MLNIVDIVVLAFSALRERRLRSILTILGIAIGPAAMVSIIGTTEGYTSTIVSQLQSLGQNTVVLFPAKGYRLSDSDVDRIKTLEEVDTLTPFYQSRGQFRKPDGTTMVVTIYALDLNLLNKIIVGSKIAEGMIPPPTLYTYCVVGDKVVSSDKVRYYGVGDAITVNILVMRDGKPLLKTVSTRISGVLAPYGSVFPVNPDESIFLPLQAGRSLLNLRDYSGIFIIAKSADLVDSLVSRLKDIYGDNVQIMSLKEIAKTVSNIINILDNLFFTVSSISFAVAFTGIMSTMFTSVVERTREIGVLKALGFSSNDVLTLFLFESILMTLIGVVSGITGGIIGAYFIAYRPLRLVGTWTVVSEPKITWWLITRALGLSLAVGVVGGLLPAWKASKMVPVEALRYE